MSDTLPEEIIYCTYHPEQETRLRCNRCEKPICPKCMILTPTGYRCRACVHGQQKTFETAQVPDYFIALIAAGLLSVIASLLIFFINVGFLTIFVAPLVGNLIGNLVRRLTGKRRSKKMFYSAAAGAAAGAVPALLIITFGALLSGGGSWALISLVWQFVYAGLAASTTYYQLSGITIRH